jgi:hypothetical protein
VGEPLGATDAGGRPFRPHRTYQMPFALVPVALPREGDGKVCNSINSWEWTESLVERQPLRDTAEMAGSSLVAET